MPETRAKRVLVLQGGGALGAYQAGVYEALSKSDFQPEWIAGVSIGSINAALIAGNDPEKRVDALRAFWDLISTVTPFHTQSENGQIRSSVAEANAALAMLFGVPGFFTPRFPPPFFALPGTASATSFYDTAPLRETLEKFTDFDRINAKKTRVSVGAVNVRSGLLEYFDNHHDTITPEHIMASSALPPGFPPIEIAGEFYWDGGVVSNTPLEYVLDQDMRHDLLIFQVDLFNASGELPRTIAEAIEREKDIRYASRTRHNTRTTLKIHREKLALQSLLKSLPESLRQSPTASLVDALAEEHSVKVMQLIYRSKPHESSSKDYEFSRHAMVEHWQAGVADARSCDLHREKIDRRPVDITELIDVADMSMNEEGSG